MQRVHVDVSDLKAEPPRMSQNNMVGVAAVGGSVFVLVIHNFAGFQLQFEAVGDEGDELTVGGLTLGVWCGNSSTNNKNPATTRLTQN